MADLPLSRSSLSSLSAPSGTPRATTIHSSSSSRPLQRPHSSSSSSSSSSSPHEPLTEPLRVATDKETKVDQAELLDALRSLLASGPSSAPPGPGHVSSLQQALGQRPSIAAAASKATTARSALLRMPVSEDLDALQLEDGIAPSLDERMAEKIIERALSMGSFSLWAQSQQFRAVRNKNEVLVLAQALDAFMKDQVPMQSLGVEILCRRLAAVHLADQSSNWKMADAIQLPTVTNSLLPQAELHQAIRTASSLARMEASLRPRQPARRYAGHGGGGGGYGGGARPNRGAYGRGGFGRAPNSGRYPQQQHHQQQQQTFGRAGSSGVGASNQ